MRIAMKIKKTINCLIITLFIIILPGKAHGQEQDFGIWYSINTVYPLSKKLDMTLKASLRTYQDAAIMDELYLEGGLSYDINQYLSAAASARIAEAREDNGEYHVRYKYFASVKGKLPVGRFAFSTRAMLMVISRTYVENEDVDRTFSTLRLKLKLEYDIKDFPVDPYLGFESFTKIVVDSETIIDKARFFSGFEYTISEKHSLELEYMLDRYLTPDLSYIHLISATYNYSF
jgi:hypothetical protein